MTVANMKIAGAILFGVGAIGMIALWLLYPFVPPEAGGAASGDSLAAIRAQTLAIQEHTRGAYVRQNYWWIFDYSLKGGFVLWVAGSAVELLRRQHGE